MTARMSTYAPTVEYSAQGTKLNRRGIETRRLILETAIQVLAEGAATPPSANLVAREAGVTWGTIQHQFGDADGVWAAVLDHVEGLTDDVLLRVRHHSSLRRQIAEVVRALWKIYDTDTARAVENLRRGLPNDQQDLAVQYPQTAARLRRLDQAWEVQWSSLFESIDTSATKLRKLSTMLPGALRGLHDQARMTSFTADIDTAVDCLIDSVTAYLS